MGIVIDARNQQLVTRSDRCFSKDHKKADAKRVIFPEYWRDSNNFITHNHQDSSHKQHLNESDHNKFYHTKPNSREKRKIFSFDVKDKSVNFPHNRQRFRGTQSLPCVKRNQTEQDSTLSLPEKQSPSRVSFNPKVSIHLFDLAEVEEAISNKSTVRGWWSQYLPF